MRRSLAGLVLSGGLSTRMHVDKGSLVFRATSGTDHCIAETQRSRCYRLLRSVCSSAFISCRKSQAALVPSHLPCIFDSVQGEGPGVGILSAFNQDRNLGWFILACDMPLIDEAEIGFIFRERDPDKAATLFAHSQLEPLCGIWEPQALLALEDAFKNGNYGLKHTLKDLPCKLLKPASEDRLMNVNTPSQLRAAALYDGQKVKA